MAFMRYPLYILMQDGKVKIYKTTEEECEGPVVISGWSQDLFDEIVMMRYYNMTQEERRAAVDRVIHTQHETGADGVRKAYGLPTVMERALAEAQRRPVRGPLEPS